MRQNLFNKNDKIVKSDKKAADYLNEFFSSIVKNLDIKWYKIGSHSFVDSNIVPILKAFLKHKKHPSIIAVNEL